MTLSGAGMLRHSKFGDLVGIADIRKLSDRLGGKRTRSIVSPGSVNSSSAYRWRGRSVGAIMLPITWRPCVEQAEAANATGRDSRHAESCYRLSNIGLDRLCRRDVVVTLGGIAFPEFGDAAPVKRSRLPRIEFERGRVIRNGVVELS